MSFVAAAILSLAFDMLYKNKYVKISAFVIKLSFTLAITNVLILTMNVNVKYKVNFLNWFVF